MNTAHRLLAVASLSTLLLAGCHITETGTGSNKKVDIGTPFGSMKVNTNDAGDLSAIGLSAYPGAVPDKGDNDKDEHNNADVNLSFGDFHLGVKAASFHTPDSTEKVLAFYRKDLHNRYGDVIECQDDKPIGTPTHTSQGLTCSDSKGTHVDTDDDKGKKGISLHGTLNGNNIGGNHDSVELRSGSQQHQHIVGVDPKDGGTKIGLVMLDLPSHLGDRNGKDPE
jgi:hypothetical protein